MKVLSNLSWLFGKSDFPSKEVTVNRRNRDRVLERKTHNEKELSVLKNVGQGHSLDLTPWNLQKEVGIACIVSSHEEVKNSEGKNEYEDVISPQLSPKL